MSDVLLAATVLESIVAGGLDVVRAAVETATGWPGLLVIAVYSFLIAFILPGPSEIVLAAPIELGLGSTGNLAVIVLVSGLGKAAGSVLALRVGHEVKESGRVLRFFEERGWNVREWSERHTVRLAERYGYIGLALALCVPFFPDTLSIYAFTVLEDDYVKFAAATFVGSVGRLLVTLFLIGGTLLVV